MKTNAEHTFGKTLQDARETKGLSLAQAATLLDVPKTSLWRWESNETKVDAQRLLDIAVAYGLSVPAIFEGKVEIPKTQTDLGLLGNVVEFVENEIQRYNAKPTSFQVQTIVVEIIHLESLNALATNSDEFDVSRYAALLSAFFRRF